MKNYINEINFHEIEAQKYWSPPASYSEEKKKTEIRNAIFGGDYIGSRKMDGAFFKFIKDDDGNMELIGRNKSVKGDYLNKINHVPQLHSFFNELPNGTCLLGELYFPNNEGSSNVTTIIGCLEQKARDRQENGDKLYYYIFDVLAWNGESLLKKNIEDRIDLLNLIKNKYISISKYILFAKYFEGSELWNQLQQILANGGEGIVITRKGTCYQPGKRPAHQSIKVKKELRETIDCIVMGANSPTKEYTGKEIESWKYWLNLQNNEKINDSCYKEYFNGAPLIPITKNYFNEWAGSLTLGLVKDNKVIQVGNLSGLSEEILANWKDYKGKVCSIMAMEVLPTGGFRHPKFIQWREDLRVEDCTWEKVFG